MPAEIARLAVLIACSDADYVTGSSDVIDGGSMRNLGLSAYAVLSCEAGAASNPNSRADRAPRWWYAALHETTAG